MTENNTLLPAPHKFSWVVKDIQVAKAEFSRQLAISQWEEFEYEALKEDIVIGTPFVILVAQAKVGKGLTFELVQPVKGDSVWAKFLESNGEGFHLMCYSVPETWDQVVSKLKEVGSKTLAQAKFDGLNWCYVEMEVGGRSRFEITEEEA